VMGVGSRSTDIQRARKHLPSNDALRGVASGFRHAAVRTFVCVLATCLLTAASSTRAEAITYTFANYPGFQNHYVFEGSITTDGTLGVLTASNITGWSYSLYDASHHLILSSGGKAATELIGLTASATQLTLPRGDESTLLFSQKRTSYEVFNLLYVNQLDMQCYTLDHQYKRGGRGAWSYYYFWIDETYPPQDMTLPSADWAIATNAAVPEPSALVLWTSLGAVGLIAAWRPRKRAT